MSSGGAGDSGAGDGGSFGPPHLQSSGRGRGHGRGRGSGDRGRGHIRGGGGSASLGRGAVGPSKKLNVPFKVLTPRNRR
jgi:hypothetical protein